VTTTTTPSVSLEVDAGRGVDLAPRHTWSDLAPGIHRQRLVVEGIPAESIGARQIRNYLCRLSDLCGMVALIEPVTHRSDRFGWAGWIHWETSGAHFYAWDQPQLFFSVDIYACKAFDAAAVVEFTARCFDTSEIVAKGL
jgi:hypothetical protein